MNDAVKQTKVKNLARLTQYGIIEYAIERCGRLGKALVPSSNSGPTAQAHSDSLAPGFAPR